MKNTLRSRKPFFILIPVILFFVLGGLVMVLWNYTLPQLFNTKSISYWQALGLFALCRILFGSFGFGKNRRPPFVNKELRDKMFNMSAEERENFKAEWKQRCRP